MRTPERISRVSVLVVVRQTDHDNGSATRRKRRVDAGSIFRAWTSPRRASRVLGGTLPSKILLARRQDTGVSITDFAKNIILAESITMTSAMRATCWSVTLNMKNVKQSSCDEMINTARSAGWKVTGQEEMGEENPHYQLMVQTPQVRFSAVKKMFPTGHIEVARNRQALAQYVTKEDTRVGALPEHDEKYVTASRLWDMIYKYNSGCDDDCWDMTNEHDVVMYKDHEQRAIEKDPLAFFDKMISVFIRQGYFVDMLACNPAIRSFWKKFWRDILYRSRETDRQTDRQAEKLSQSVTIPTIDAGTEDKSENSEESAPSLGLRDSDEESASCDSERRDESGSSSSDADDDW